MPISDKVIVDAVARYDRERDRYIKLAARVADICRSNIVEGNAIRAQVTSRTKTVRSFEGKLRRFAKRADKNFTTVDDVFSQVGDFAGVRVATYRPEDEAKVANEIATLFAGPDGGKVEIDLKDKLSPADCLFYRATHCQVALRDEELVGDYGNLRGASCEIQICSMMAHVWNEIEHDIGYKPEGGGPGEAEKGLLETLGHLTRSGDAAITRLLAANYERLTAQTGDFTDVHDFVARLRTFFPDADLSVNAGQAFDEAQLLGLNSVEKIKATLGDDSLDAKVGRARISQFNEFMIKAGYPQRMNAASADLIIIAMLHKCSEQIKANHPSEGSKSLPVRIYNLALQFREFAEALPGKQDAA